MMFTLPLLLDRVFGRGVHIGIRGLAVLGVVAAVAGVLLSATRQPIVSIVLASLVYLVLARLSPGAVLAAFTLAAMAITAASFDERLQRVFTVVDDTDVVENRIRGSANEEFWELIFQYPFGAGMGSAVGTSIPYFLASRAPKPIGLENEFSRILVDQGWIGLGIWLVFLYWLFSKRPISTSSSPFGVAVLLSFSLCIVSWATAFIGNGGLTAIPQTVLMFVALGLLARERLGQTDANP